MGRKLIGEGRTRAQRANNARTHLIG